MKAVILVGGVGSRLRPLTLTRPKQMLPILHRPKIEHVVDHLAQYGIEEAVLSMGYRPDAFTEAWPDGVCGGVKLHYAVEPEPLDTAGAIHFSARDAGITDRFLVVNGDVLTDLDIAELIAFHDARGAEGTIALHRVVDPSAFGVVPTDDAGRVLAFVEKPPAGEAPTDLINAGTYVLEASALDRIPEGRKVSIERETFPAMVKDRSLFALPAVAYWIDAGTPAQYLQAQIDLVDGLRGAQSEGISPAASISPEATVERSVIGSGVDVGAQAVVRCSIVMPDAFIGEGARLTETIIGANARVEAGAVLDGYTVLGDGVRAEAGERLHGVRRPHEP